MKRITVLSALVVGAAMTQQAFACDFMHREASSARTAAACDGGNCTPVPAARQKAARPEPAAAQTPAPAARSEPTIVACKGNAC